MTLEAGHSNGHAAQPQKEPSHEVGIERRQGHDGNEASRLERGSREGEGRSDAEGRDGTGRSEGSEVGEPRRLEPHNGTPKNYGVRQSWVCIKGEWQIVLSPFALRRDGSQAKYPWGDGAMPTHWQPGDPPGWMEIREPKMRGQDAARELLNKVNGDLRKASEAEIELLLQQLTLELLSESPKRHVPMALQMLKKTAQFMAAREKRRLAEIRAQKSKFAPRVPVEGKVKKKRSKAAQAEEIARRALELQDMAEIHKPRGRISLNGH